MNDQPSNPESVPIGSKSVDRPICGKCGKPMTPEDSTMHPELFLHDACLPTGLLLREARTPKPEPETPVIDLGPKQKEETPVAGVEPQWGIEDTGDHLWIGPMRRDGSKVNEIVADYDLRDLTPEAEKRYRQLANIIVNCVNQAGPQSDTIRTVESKCSTLTARVAELEGALDYSQTAVHADATVKKLTADLSTARARIAELEDGRDAGTEMLGGAYQTNQQLRAEVEALRAERQQMAIKLGSYTLPPHIEAELSSLRAELQSAQNERLR